MFCSAINISKNESGFLFLKSCEYVELLIPASNEIILVCKENSLLRVWPYIFLVANGLFSKIESFISDIKGDFLSFVLDSLAIFE